MTSLERALQEIKSYVETRMQEVNMPGLALAVTDQERLLEVATFGYADIASRSPIGESTMFEVGSIGKSFTNIALMQLHDEGRLDLHAPVSRYLPWFDVQSDHELITTHHLMSHTSGLGSGTDIGSHGLYEAWALRDSRTGSAPGSHFRYSNVGYKLLGFLLEELGRPSLPGVHPEASARPPGHAALSSGNRLRHAETGRRGLPQLLRRPPGACGPRPGAGHVDRVRGGRWLPGLYRRGYGHLPENVHERRDRSGWPGCFRGELPAHDAESDCHSAVGRRTLRLWSHPCQHRRPHLPGTWRQHHGIRIGHDRGCRRGNRGGGPDQWAGAVFWSRKYGVTHAQRAQGGD